jgi:hypothetical protein
MPGQFADAHGEKLLQEIGSLFRDKPVFRRSKSHFMFVCGGAIKAGATTMRRQFISWAQSSLPDFNIVVAEHAFPEATLDHPEFINLAQFEHLVAQISDCVLIFPESAGSYAEIGYFAATATIRRKVLVVNNRKFETKDSFVNLGPVSTIDGKSTLRPALHLPGSIGPGDFEPLNERLDRIRNQRRTRRKLDHRPFNQLDYGERFCVLLELIRLLRAVTLEGLKRSIAASFDAKKPSDLNMLLSVLIASGFVTRQDEYLIPTATSKSLLEIESADVDTIIARVLFYYREYDPRAFSFAKG